MAPRYPRPRPPRWTSEQDARLAYLWQLGLPARVIAKSMGKTHNAICARRARLGLPGRPSPIPQTQEESAVKVFAEHLHRKQVRDGLCAARAAIAKAA
jgi:hypothetical protein